MEIVDQSCDCLPILLDDRYSELLQGFELNGILTAEVLLSSPGALSRKINHPAEEIESFVKRYKDESRSHLFRKGNLRTLEDDTLASTTAGVSESTTKQIYFTTGDDEIDSSLNGGIPCGYLIEISGDSATGKSNFLMSLAITIQLPIEFGGLGRSIFNHNSDQAGVKTMYISTESALSTQRLEQISIYYRDLLCKNGINDASLYPDMKNVMTTSTAITDLESQNRCLYYQLPVILERSPEIKMVVVDSITHHIRAELRFGDRDSYVMKICRHLKQLALKYSVTVLIANQVTDKPLNGIFSSQNELLFKMNFDYQTSWLVGWDDVGVVYRQLMEKKKKKPWEKDKDLDTYEEIGYTETTPETSSEESFSNDTSIVSIKEQMRVERKRLFASKYRTKVSKIKTIPSLGISLMNVINARIVLKKEFIPILNEDLIDEFSTDLGIDTSSLNSPIS
ncbi:hypothetical protein FOA43_001116 [Brettanomyces nanus]|uniref:RecA family profile 1 domain-containing protein n=1 Tax=Eeniella nana TaxID=13502 RepID=A0A875S116_EENNA|nr:uncharacterized protein FOA43_001116 [Brettanomyces nanus]QPG73802.1 hypothetical protein FOA43_001116 [Brettanomyces nanus]